MFINELRFALPEEKAKGKIIWCLNSFYRPIKGWLFHIMVDDIKETMKKVIGNEGKIVQPVGLEVPEITARFSDPTGNILGLFQQ